MPAARITALWWRVLQLGEFFNIERRPDLISGGGGSRYIEIPSSMTVPTLEFFDQESAHADGRGFTINAAAIGLISNEVFDINVQVKAGGRLRIANQNRQATPNRRHPAWSSQAGFPTAPNDVASRQDAAAYFPPGGVRVFVGKTSNDSYVAGFTQGPPPDYLPITSELRRLYANVGVGGVLWDADMPIRTAGE